jgi:hypothetical protein
MASFEGIPSAFAAQPSARSPKLRLYESPFLWNHSVDQLVAVLRGLEKLPFADKRGLQCTQAKSKNFVPASTLISRRRSANVNAATRADSGNNAPTRRRWKILTTSTLKWKNKRNSDASKDCRRVSASPHSAMAEEQERTESEQPRKKQLARKHRKPTANAQSPLREKRHD